MEERQSMNERNEKDAFQHILVALDASRHSLAALKAAVELAASLEAELQALFVEDINLLQVANSPMAQEICYPFSNVTPLNPRRMERQLRAQATQARQSLADACDPQQIKWSFRVVRGEVASEVLAAATEADLLSLGTTSRPLIRRVRLGSTARAAAAQSPSSVLLLQHNVAIKPPVVVTYDGSSTAQRALRIAARLAQRQGGYLVALLVADDPNATQQWQAQISDFLREMEIMLLVHYRQLVNVKVKRRVHKIQSEESGTLVLSNTILDPEALQMLLDQAGYPVLLVR